MHKYICYEEQLGGGVWLEVPGVEVEAATRTEAQAIMNADPQFAGRYPMAVRADDKRSLDDRIYRAME